MKERTSVPPGSNLNLSSPAEMLLHDLSTPISQLILGSAPYVGGVGAYISAVAAAKRGVVIEEFLSDVAEELSSLQRDRPELIDKAFLDSTEFAVIICRILDQVGLTGGEQQLLHLRRFIANSVRHFRPDVTLLGTFLSLLPGLSGAHVMILNRLYEAQESVAASDRLGKVRTNKVPIGRAEITGGIQDSTLSTLLTSDLIARGLVVDWATLTSGGNFDKEFCLTRTGFALMRFISGGWSASPGKTLHD